MSVSNLQWIDFGMKTPPHDLFMSDGKIHIMVYERVLTLFQMERGHFVFFHRVKMKLVDVVCRVDRC